MEELKQKSEPSLEEIATRECGCRCGVEGCEFAADFFNDRGTPSAEFGQDEDLLNADAEMFSVTAVDNAYGRAAVEEYADAVNAYAERKNTAEFGDDMPVNEGPVTDDIEYRHTAEYTMIDPDDEAFDTMGS